MKDMKVKLINTERENGQVMSFNFFSISQFGHGNIFMDEYLYPSRYFPQMDTEGR